MLVIAAAEPYQASPVTWGGVKSGSVSWIRSVLEVKRPQHGALGGRIEGEPHVLVVVVVGVVEDRHEDRLGCLTVGKCQGPRHGRVIHAGGCVPPDGLVSGPSRFREFRGCGPRKLRRLRPFH